MIRTRGQLVARLQQMKQGKNDNSIKHIKHEDIDEICNYLLEDKHIIEQLEKALDKAIDTLMLDDWEDKDGVPMTKEIWKERLMNNDII